MNDRRAHRRPIGSKRFYERDLVMLQDNGAAAFGGSVGGEGGHDELGTHAGSQALRLAVRFLILLSS